MYIVFKGEIPGTRKAQAPRKVLVAHSWQLHP